MGANSTQAQGVTLFLVGFTLICVGLALDYSVISLLLGLVAVGISIALFLKCKPWEHREE
jgi:purine-cytosine permease-like protein